MTTASTSSSQLLAESQCKSGDVLRACKECLPDHGGGQTYLYGICKCQFGARAGPIVPHQRHQYLEICVTDGQPKISWKTHTSDRLRRCGKTSAYSTNPPDSLRVQRQELPVLQCRVRVVHGSRLADAYKETPQLHKCRWSWA